MKNILIMLLFSVLFLPSAAGATGDSSKSAPWYEGTELHSFVSTGYEYNLNRPDNQKNGFRVFDFDDNTMKVDVLELVLKKEPVEGGAGFRVDLTAGSSIPQIAHSAGLNSGDLDFHQMYASFIAPLGSGLRIDAGKFITPMGYEVIEGYDGSNDNYSRSFLFGYAIPFTHTGIKGSYAFSTVVSASVFICNGWDLSADNNRSKTVGLQVGLAPLAGLNLGLNAAAGPEKAGDNSDYRKIFDLTGSYVIDHHFTIGVNADLGVEEHSGAGNGNATWKGVAGYGRVNVCEQFAFIARAEFLEDCDGIRTGVIQRLAELTLTPEYRFASHMIIRGEFRIDNSNQEAFLKAGSPTHTQSTLGLNLMYSY